MRLRRRGHRQPLMTRQQASPLLVLTGERAPRLLWRTAAPMLDDRLNDRVALLDALRPLVVRTANHARRRRDQHQCPHQVWVRGREQHGQRTALSNRDQDWLLRTDSVDHRKDIIDLLLQWRRASNPTGHPGPAPIELDQPRERRQLLKKTRRRRQLPPDLDVREELRHDQDIERPLTGHLVGDLHTAATCIPSLRNLHRATLPPRWAQRGCSAARRSRGRTTSRRAARRTGIVWDAMQTAKRRAATAKPDRASLYHWEIPGPDGKSGQTDVLGCARM